MPEARTLPETLYGPLLMEDIDGYLQSDETQRVMLLLEGNDEKKTAFLAEFSVWGQSRPGFTGLQSGVERRENDRIMYGASYLFTAKTYYRIVKQG